MSKHFGDEEPEGNHRKAVITIMTIPWILNSIRTNQAAFDEWVFGYKKCFDDDLLSYKISKVW